MKEEIAGSGNGDLLKSLVSISDAINEQIFNANQTIDGSFINRQAIIADTGPIETLKLQLEKSEQEEQNQDILIEANEKAASDREEQERAREEAWDNSMHNVAGMDLSGTEIDSIIDTIKNPLRKAEIIAKRAKDKNISPQEAEQQLNMTLAYLDAKKKIDKGQGTDADKALVNTIEHDPEKSEIVRDNVSLIQGHTLSSENANDKNPSISRTTGDMAAMEARASILSSGVVTTSVSVQDGNSINAKPLTPNFNSQSGINAANNLNNIENSLDANSTGQVIAIQAQTKTLGAPTASASI